MRTDSLISTFPDGSGVEIHFDIDMRTIVININEEAQRQRYQLNFEHCGKVIITYNDPDFDGSPDHGIVNLLEKTAAESSVRYFHIEFFDDTYLEIYCSNFWMEPIDGFLLHANPPPHH